LLTSLKKRQKKFSKQNDYHINIPQSPIQPKLKISQPNNPYEIEADRVADQIMRMSVSDSINLEISDKYESGIHRKCSKCKMMNKKDEELKISRKPLSSTSDLKVSDNFTSGINSSNGKPLDIATKNFLEPRFGYDFSDVRVHNDSKSQYLATSVNARAFTYGNDIFLGSGESISDSKLLAHELTHVVQNNITTSTIQRQEDENVVELPQMTITGCGRTISEDHSRCVREADERRNSCLSRGSIICSIFGGVISRGRRGVAGGSNPVGGGVAGGGCMAFYRTACEASHHADQAFCSRKRNCLLGGVRIRKQPSDCEGWFSGWTSGGTGDPWPDFETSDCYSDWYW